MSFNSNAPDVIVIDKAKKKIMDKKWARLEKEGITRPKTSAENLKRIREAHVGN